MFDSHGGLPLGARDGRILNAALDASYRLSRDWSATGWVSRNEIARNQAQTDGLQIWEADLATVGYAVGFGVRGSPREDLLLGANIRYSHDMNEYELDTRTGPPWRICRTSRTSGLIWAFGPITKWVMVAA